MLEARSISYAVKGKKKPKQILSSVSLKVLPGKLTALVGPNGAGKSTLMAHLTGELTPQAGEVYIGQTPMHHLPSAELANRRAVLPQAHRVGFNYQVHEVVAMGAYGHSRLSIKRPLQDCMQAMEIDQFAERTYNTLSGGEKQRVHLARCLLQLSLGKEHLLAEQQHSNGSKAQPPDQYLLLDEPTNNLDLKYQFFILNQARNLVAQGLGVLAILHDLQLATRYADYVAVINNGKVIAYGEAFSVLQPPIIHEVFGIEASYIQTSPGKKMLVTLA